MRTNGMLRQFFGAFLVVVIIGLAITTVFVGASSLAMKYDNRQTELSCPITAQAQGFNYWKIVKVPRAGYFPDEERCYKSYDKQYWGTY